MSSPDPTTNPSSDPTSNGFTCAVRIRPLIARDAALPICVETFVPQPESNPWLANITVQDQSLSGTQAQSDGREFLNIQPVIGPEVSQNQCYSILNISKMVKEVIQGFHCTILAYGQTGSGKTYTVLGGESQLDGIIPQALVEIFSERERVLQESSNLQQQQQGSNPGALPTSMKEARITSCRIRASFIEVGNAPGFVNEVITDLLDNSKANLQVRYGDNAVPFVSDLTCVECESASDALMVLNEGAKYRRTSSTKMNERSSRSHSMFCLYVETTTESIMSDGVSKRSVQKMSKFQFVDLAGSERVKSSQAEGNQLKETQTINKSLFTLASVIQAVADNSKSKGGRHVHVPYRNSKITELLSDSFGGNSYTMFITCITPTSPEETILSLSYTTRAMGIQNRPKKNVLQDSVIGGGPPKKGQTNSPQQKQAAKKLREEASDLRDENARLLEQLEEARKLMQEQQEQQQNQQLAQQYNPMDPTSMMAAMMGMGPMGMAGGFPPMLFYPEGQDGGGSNIDPNLDPNNNNSNLQMMFDSNGQPLPADPQMVQQVMMQNWLTQMQSAFDGMSQDTSNNFAQQMQQALVGMGINLNLNNEQQEGLGGESGLNSGDDDFSKQQQQLYDDDDYDLQNDNSGQQTKNQQQQQQQNTDSDERGDNSYVAIALKKRAEREKQRKLEEKQQQNLKQYVPIQGTRNSFVNRSAIPNLANLTQAGANQQPLNQQQQQSSYDAGVSSRGMIAGPLVDPNTYANMQQKMAQKPMIAAGIGQGSPNGGGSTGPSGNRMIDVRGSVIYDFQKYESQLNEAREKAEEEKRRRKQQEGSSNNSSGSSSPFMSSSVSGEENKGVNRNLKNNFAEDSNFQQANLNAFSSASPKSQGLNDGKAQGTDGVPSWMKNQTRKSITTTDEFFQQAAVQQYTKAAESQLHHADVNDKTQTQNNNNSNKSSPKSQKQTATSSLPLPQQQQQSSSPNAQRRLSGFLFNPNLPAPAVVREIQRRASLQVAANQMAAKRMSLGTNSANNQTNTNTANPSVVQGLGDRRQSDFFQNLMHSLKPDQKQELLNLQRRNSNIGFSQFQALSKAQDDLEKKEKELNAAAAEGAEKLEKDYQITGAANDDNYEGFSPIGPIKTNSSSNPISLTKDPNGRVTQSGCGGERNGTSSKESNNQESWANKIRGYAQKKLSQFSSSKRDSTNKTNNVLSSAGSQMIIGKTKISNPGVVVDEPNGDSSLTVSQLPSPNHYYQSYLSAENQFDDKINRFVPVISAGVTQQGQSQFTNPIPDYDSAINLNDTQQRGIQQVLDYASKDPNINTNSLLNARKNSKRIDIMGKIGQHLNPVGIFGPLPTSKTDDSSNVNNDIDNFDSQAMFNPSMKVNQNQSRLNGNFGMANSLNLKAPNSNSSSSTNLVNQNQNNMQIGGSSGSTAQVQSSYPVILSPDELGTKRNPYSSGSNSRSGSHSASASAASQNNSVNEHNNNNNRNTILGPTEARPGSPSQSTRSPRYRNSLSGTSSGPGSIYQQPRRSPRDRAQNNSNINSLNRPYEDPRKNKLESVHHSPDMSDIRSIALKVQDKIDRQKAYNNEEMRKLKEFEKQQLSEVIGQTKFGKTYSKQLIKEVMQNRKNNNSISQRPGDALLNSNQNELERVRNSNRNNRDQEDHNGNYDDDDIKKLLPSLPIENLFSEEQSMWNQRYTRHTDFPITKYDYERHKKQVDESTSHAYSQLASMNIAGIKRKTQLHSASSSQQQDQQQYGDLGYNYKLQQNNELGNNDIINDDQRLQNIKISDIVNDLSATEQDLNHLFQYGPNDLPPLMSSPAGINERVRNYKRTQQQQSPDQNLNPDHLLDKLDLDHAKFDSLDHQDLAPYELIASVESQLKQGIQYGGPTRLGDLKVSMDYRQEEEEKMKKEEEERIRRLEEILGQGSGIRKIQKDPRDVTPDRVVAKTALDMIYQNVSKKALEQYQIKLDPKLKSPQVSPYDGYLESLKEKHLVKEKESDSGANKNENEKEADDNNSKSISISLDEMYNQLGEANKSVQQMIENRGMNDLNLKGSKGGKSLLKGGDLFKGKDSSSKGDSNFKGGFPVDGNSVADYYSGKSGKKDQYGLGSKGGKYQQYGKDINNNFGKGQYSQQTQVSFQKGLKPGPSGVTSKQLGVSGKKGKQQQQVPSDWDDFYDDDIISGRNAPQVRISQIKPHSHYLQNIVQQHQQAYSTYSPDDPTGSSGSAQGILYTNLMANSQFHGKTIGELDYSKVYEILDQDPIIKTNLVINKSNTSASGNTLIGNMNTSSEAQSESQSTSNNNNVESLAKQSLELAKKRQEQYDKNQELVKQMEEQSQREMRAVNESQLRAHEAGKPLLEMAKERASAGSDTNMSVHQQPSSSTQIVVVGGGTQSQQAQQELQQQQQAQSFKNEATNVTAPPMNSQSLVVEKSESLATTVTNTAATKTNQPQALTSANTNVTASVPVTTTVTNTATGVAASVPVNTNTSSPKSKGPAIPNTIRANNSAAKKKNKSPNIKMVTPAPRV